MQEKRDKQRCRFDLKGFRYTFQNTARQAPQRDFCGEHARKLLQAGPVIEPVFVEEPVKTRLNAVPNRSE